MSNEIRNEYKPDTVTAPGFYIQEKLEELGMTQTDLAGRIGRTKKTVNEIITGKAPIEPETALQLERVLGIPARFWSFQRQYRDHLVRQQERAASGTACREAPPFSGQGHVQAGMATQAHQFCRNAVRTLKLLRRGEL